MPKKFHKYKLLLDENFSIRSSFPLLNRRFDVKHIATDLRLAGMPDSQVYELARIEGRLLITYNTKDFSNLALKSIETGVIGVSANLSIGQIDKKLVALLIKSSKRTLFGKLTVISGEK